LAPSFITSAGHPGLLPGRPACEVLHSRRIAECRSPPGCARVCECAKRAQPDACSQGGG
jgi:hypothetical protein